MGRKPGGSFLPASSALRKVYAAATRPYRSSLKTLEPLPVASRTRPDAPLDLAFKALCNLAARPRPPASWRPPSPSTA